MVLNDSVTLSFVHSFIHLSMHGHLFSKSIGYLLHAREIVSWDYSSEQGDMLYTNWENLNVESQRQISINVSWHLPFLVLNYFPHCFLIAHQQELKSKHMTILLPEHSRTFSVLNSPKVLFIVCYSGYIFLFFGPALPCLLFKCIC